MKPRYYKVIWHNCTKCRTHYTSDDPHLRAYLCNECWDAMPKYKAVYPKKKGPTHKLPNILRDISLTEIMLYTVGNLICLAVIGYYLWFK